MLERYTAFVCIRCERFAGMRMVWLPSRKIWVQIKDNGELIPVRRQDRLDMSGGGEEIAAERRSMFPGDLTDIILHGTDEKAETVTGRWGFTPFWAKDDKFGKKSGYNARSETVYEKPTWRKAIKSQRCVVPADGFFERAHL